MAYALVAFVILLGFIMEVVTVAGHGPKCVVIYRNPPALNSKIPGTSSFFLFF